MKEELKIRPGKIENAIELRRLYMNAEKNKTDDLEKCLINYLDAIGELTDAETMHYLFCLYGD